MTETQQGGPSTATGISFQALAIAKNILDVYQGQADFVRAEVPPHAELGDSGLLPVTVDDYVVQRNRIRIYHQAKSNAPGGGTWTLTKLIREEIFQTFYRQTINDIKGECCLVTPCDCPLFGKLAEWARESQSDEEFMANLSSKDRSLIMSTCRELDIDPVVCRGFLRRCTLQVYSVAQLRGELEAVTRVLFADPKGALDGIFALAISAMTKRQQLDKITIDTFFQERAAFSRPKASEKDLLDAIGTASTRLRRIVQSYDERGNLKAHILQPTVDKIFDWISKGDFKLSSVAALLDQAGSGKTVAISVLQNRLELAGYKVLGIKVDGLVFSSSEELATALDLPASIPSIVQILCTAGHRVAILIDQVDALSSAMARESSAITVILDLVNRLQTIKDVPVVVACRLFDWKYDHRLKTLQGGHSLEFPLPELTDTQLSDILSAYSLTIKDLHPLTVKIIRCPLRLRMLMDVVEVNRRESPDWSPSSRVIYTLQSLYEEFWKLKTRKAEEDRVGAATIETVTSTLAHYMHDHEHLSAPDVLVASQRPAVDWLISEGILNPTGKTLTFFHQTFFDFIFARGFVQKDQSLVEHLAATDQGLFYRPMTRQILEYLRDTDPESYLRELKGILEDSRIREHLRWLVIAWLGQQVTPWGRELDLLEPFLTDSALRPRILGNLRGNPAWFDLLTVGRFERWLQSLPEPEIDRVVWYLNFLFPLRQTAIAELLSRYLGHSQEWNARIAYCLHGLEKDWENGSIELLLKLVGHPLTNLDQDRHFLFSWGHALKTLAALCPDKACEAVGIILERFTPRWVNIGTENLIQDLRQKEGYLPRDHDFLETLSILGEKAPGIFLTTVLPWTLARMESTCSSRNELSFRSSWQLWDLDNSLHDNPTEVLIKAIGKAAVNLVKIDPGTLRSLIPSMLGDDYESMQIIITETFMANPQEFASDAAHFIEMDSRRLCLDKKGSDSWYSVQLIQTCCPFWSSIDIQRVERSILSLKEWKPTSPDHLRRQGRTHLLLLRALDSTRLSGDGKNRLGQLERKFPDFKPREPSPDLAWYVGSPISQDHTKKMNDKAWLRAMKKYTGDYTPHDRPLEKRGGRSQLSQALKERAKEQPERFFRLAFEQMNESYDICYIKAIISGIAEACIAVEKLEEVIRKFLTVLESRSVCEPSWAINKYAETSVPDSLIVLLKKWSLHAPHPKPEKLPRRKKQGNKIQGQDLLTEGMNTERGAALWTLAHVLLKGEPPKRNAYLDVADKVTKDPSNAVRSVCLSFLEYAVFDDPGKACKVFKRLIGKNKRLLGEDSAYRFVHRTYSRHIDKVFWAISRMVGDKHCDNARKHGAMLACLSAFCHPEAYALRDTCLSGDIFLREGAATVYSANVTDVQVGEECRQRLLLLMEDTEPAVRKEAVSFLRNLEDKDLRDMPDFLRAWSRSKAIDEGAEEVAYTLEKHPTANPILTLDLAERIIDAIGPDIANFQVRHGGISHQLTPAILNVYHRAMDQEIKDRAINLFEKLEKLGCPEVRDALEMAERI